MQDKSEPLTNIAKTQLQMLNQLIRHHGLPLNTAQACQKHYRELRKNNRSGHSTQTLMRAALLLAQLTQTLRSVKGEPLPAMALSLNQMLKENVALLQISSLLRSHSAHNRNMNQDLRQDLGQLLDEVESGARLLTKFQRAVDYFDFRQLVDESYGYHKVFVSFVWVLFVHLLSRLGIRQERERDYLLISVFYLMIRHAFPYLRPRQLSNLNSMSQKELITSILQSLFAIFIITDLPSFKNITATVDQHFQMMMIEGIMRGSTPNQFDFLNPLLININYKKIDLQYQRRPHLIDYRHFLPLRHPTLTPAKHNSHSHKNYSKVEAPLASHKILNFDQEELQTTTNSFKRFHDLKLPANVKVSPSYQKVPLVVRNHEHLNPMQTMMIRYVRMNKVVPQKPQNLIQVQELVNGLLGQWFDEDLQRRTQLVVDFYLALTSRYFHKQQFDLIDMNGMHSAFLFYSLLIVICPLQQLAPTVQLIRTQVMVSGYHLFMANQFVKKDLVSSSQKARQLLETMSGLILSQIVWEDQEDVSEFMNTVQSVEFSQNCTIRENNIMNMAGKVLQWTHQQLSSLIGTLSSRVQCSQSFSQIQQDIFLCTQDIIIGAPHLLCGRNVFTIILCSIFMIFRKRSLFLRFNDILLSFQQTYHLSENDYKRIVTCTSNGIQSNIIQFYNTQFIAATHSIQNTSRTQNQNEINVQPVIKRNNTPRQSPAQQPLLRNAKMRQSQDHRCVTQGAQSNWEKKMTQGLSFNSRNPTKMRERPSNFINIMNTQKSKSPTYLR